MIKNEENKKMTVSNITNNSNDLNSSTRPTSFQKKKYRKDAKGNLILKKKKQKNKSNHHMYFIDKINPNKSLVSIIEIESYKQYNLDSIEEFEENNDVKEEEQLVGDNKIIKLHRCCYIF